MTRAPGSLPYLGGLLIVGNHGDGRIHAFDPHGGGLLGGFVDAAREPVAIQGLWDLCFGLNYAERHSVFFTASGEPWWGGWKPS